MRRPLTLVAALLVAAASVNAMIAGCGGNKSTENQSTEATPAPATSATATPAESTGGGGAGSMDAAAIFKQKCATCHGPTGHGDGPLAASLNPKPRNYHDKAYMSTRTDEDLYNSIFNGKSAMPPWGKSGQLTSAQVHEMVAYVRSLSQQP